MNREIKFRYYHNNWGMSNPIHFGDWDKLVHNHDQGNVIVMQYTGLKDKNGIEIYEGDIVTFGSSPSIIKFKNGGFGWDSIMFEDDFIGFAGHVNYSKIMPRCEVLGNIYQNPDLIKAGGAK